MAVVSSGGSGGGGSGGKQGKSGGGKKKGAGGAESATPSLCDCASCGASEGSIPGIKKHSACGRCKMTYYCSPKCQKGHWKNGGHKQHCVNREDRRAVEGGRSSGGKDGTSASGGSAAAAEEPECAICLEPLSQSPSQTLPCTHVYHCECVERLRSFGISRACPSLPLY